MEGETVTLQDIFEYRIDKESGDGTGQLVYSGLRPTCGKFERNGGTPARLHGPAQLRRGALPPLAQAGARRPQSRRRCRLRHPPGAR